MVVTLSNLYEILRRAFSRPEPRPVKGKAQVKGLSHMSESECDHAAELGCLQFERGSLTSLALPHSKGRVSSYV